MLFLLVSIRKNKYHANNWKTHEHRDPKKKKGKTKQANKYIKVKYQFHYIYNQS